MIEIQQPDGEWGSSKDSRAGSDPIGIIIYDSAGNMEVQIMGSNRPSVDHSAIISGKATLEEIQSIIHGYTAYFGTYELNEREGYVVHHRKGHLDPTQVGTGVKLFFKFKGDRLILISSTREARLIWKRLNLTNGDKSCFLDVDDAKRGWLD